MILQIFLWEKCSTNLLSDSTCLSCLNFRFSQLIKNKCLSCIYMTHDANDWTAELFIFVVLPSLLFFFLSLHGKLLLSLTGFVILIIIESIWLFNLLGHLFLFAFFYYFFLLNCFSNFYFLFFFIVFCVIFIWTLNWDIDILCCNLVSYSINVILPIINLYYLLFCF